MSLTRLVVGVGVLGILLFIVVWILAGNVSYIRRSGEVVIEPGTPALLVWKMFEEQDYTSSAWPWRFYAWREQAAHGIQAGTYKLEQGEHIRDVLQRLTAGEGISDEVVLTFPEGFTVEQMAERTEKSGIQTKADFMQAATPQVYSTLYPYTGSIPEGRTLEGYLFPDTYRVFPDDTAGDVVRRLMANFDQKVFQSLSADIQKSGRTLDQIIIMASIVEREVLSDTDMALVAGVLWKRLDEDMGLDADATIRYAVKKWDEPLTVTDLAIDSPYNTRRYRGLPPGPISNPGLRAIMASIHPEQSEYYYYLSAPDGTTIFSRTNDEHNVNKAKYLR